MWQVAGVEVVFGVDESVVVGVDLTTHDVLMESETTESVTVAIRPRQVKGLANAQE